MSCLPCQQASKIVRKASNIAEGYTNLVFKSNVIEELAEQRLIHCIACPKAIPLVKIGKKQYYQCSICTCPVDAKTRSTGETCPLGKW